MQELTPSVDFVPHSRIANLKGDVLYDYIIDKVSEEKILLIETGLEPTERLSLIQRGMERYSTNFTGIKMLIIKVQGERIGKFFKSKNTGGSLLLVAPASTLIDQSQEGDFSIKIKPKKKGKKKTRKKKKLIVAK